MTRILMIVYGITAEQAAARAPAAQFAVTSVIAALFVWLDSIISVAVDEYMRLRIPKMGSAGWHTTTSTKTDR